MVTRTSNIITLTTHSLPRSSSPSGTTNSVNIISSSVSSKRFLTSSSNGLPTFDRSISVGTLLTTRTDQFPSISSSATTRTTAGKTSFISSTTTHIPTSIFNDGSTLYHVTTSNGNIYFSNRVASTSTALRIETLRTEYPLKGTTEITNPEIVTYSTKLETFPTSESTNITTVNSSLLAKTTTVNSSLLTTTTTVNSTLLTETTTNKLSTFLYLLTSTHERVTDNQSFLAEKGISTRDRNIIGGVIGGCLFVVLVVIILIIYFRKIRKAADLKTRVNAYEQSKVRESDIREK
ncbi:hypothetical protein CHS0354_038293 [Potamilus streckersoni]|uniref:Uncharacterized protein n=1 Tax=Potamilus streckersoni TaxID=2493646 RepID=A0AAE0TDE1_9BIVA|nr:hypothetical protein CHS0354_038293 [Potamilus streckersoni]